jgi:hypothetical protein
MSEALIPTPGAFTISSPDSLIASIPHLVGFPPERSVVLVGIADGEVSGRRAVHLTQRFDRPADGTGRNEIHRIASAAAAPMISSGSTEVVVTVFGDDAPNFDRELPETRLVDELIDELDRGGLLVKDALYTDGSSRWSYGCDDPSCCPPEGRLISDEIRTYVAAEFAAAGSAMVESRSSLEAELNPENPNDMEGARAHVQAAEAVRATALQGGSTSSVASAAGLEEWRDRGIARVRALHEGGHLKVADAAEIAVALGDIRVRDTALWELTQAGVDRRVVTRQLTDVVRLAPEGNVAPAATVLAICQWTNGDGARANVALSRALADDPEYSLAHLVSSGLGGGLPPSQWTQAMASLSRDECRFGVKPTEPQRRAAVCEPLTRPVNTMPSAQLGIA